uniref:acid phosphatase n=1 Tax=Podarcis muralis TaxID=64176 RepID=A0A670JLF7_PODMU
MGETNPARNSKCSYFFLLGFIGSLLLQSASGRELVFVLLIYRHGDRSPIEVYPNSLHNESAWPQGFGQLTKIGMQQQYELGKYIKKRYSNFLSAEYKREEILIQSTESDRTIMSAQANLAGMYPPTVVSFLFQKLRYPILNCPRYLELLKETMHSSEFQAKIQPYKVLCAGLGMGIVVMCFFLLQSIHNLTLPVWATKEVRAKLAELTVLSLSSLFGIYKREEKARLQGDPIHSLANLRPNLPLEAAFIHNTLQMYVWVSFSQHDTTLGALQMALNIYNEKLPPYAACQFFELYQEDNGQQTVEMYFRNHTMKDPYQQTLPGCSSACPLPKFADLVSPILVDDWFCLPSSDVITSTNMIGCVALHCDFILFHCIVPQLAGDHPENAVIRSHKRGANCGSRRERKSNNKYE